MAMRVVGVLWAVCAIAFVWAAQSAARNIAGWTQGAALIAIASILLCMAEWPDARAGVYVNAAILVMLAIMRAR
jgi:hypothetical protein